MTILNARGEDIGPMLAAACVAHGIPLELALGCAIAESGLRPDAERWGTLTPQAKDAISRGDSVLLMDIINRTWPDISFGYGQQIVKFHYLGDQSASVENCLAVRRAVFNDPRANLLDMCKRLAARLRQAQTTDLTPVGGDLLLMACVLYNRGHLVTDPAEWRAIQSRVDHYRRSLTQAREVLAAQPTQGGTNMSAISERATQIGAEKLGGADQNTMGQPLSEEIEMGGGVRLQAYWNCLLIEVPGAGVYPIPAANVLGVFLGN